MSLSTVSRSAAQQPLPHCPIITSQLALQEGKLLQGNPMHPCTTGRHHMASQGEYALRGRTRGLHGQETWSRSLKARKLLPIITPKILQGELRITFHIRQLLQFHLNCLLRRQWCRTTRSRRHALQPCTNIIIRIICHALFCSPPNGSLRLFVTVVTGQYGWILHCAFSCKLHHQPP